MSPRRSTAFVLVLLFPLAACESSIATPLPAEAVPMAPLAQYRLWWDVTARCARISRSFDAVRWYIVPGASSFRVDTVDADGAYNAASNRIVLAGNAIATPGIVRHEMLHALLRGKGKHPAEFFQRRCAGVVYCDGSCAPPLTAQPASNALPLVPPSALPLDLELVPASGRLEHSGGWYVALASISNDRTDSVRVSLRVTSGPVNRAFGYADDCTRATLVTREDWFVLAPGQTRYHAFDREWCRSSGDVLTARASVGYDSTAVRQLTVYR